MDEIILRFLQGTATQAEEAELRAWRAQSAANERRFQATARVWRITRDAEPEIVAPPPPANELIRKPMHSRVEAEPPRRVLRFSRRTRAARPTRVTRPTPVAGRTPVARRTRAMLVAAAASILFAVGLGWWSLTNQAGSFAFGVDEFTTGASEKVTVRLVDGSMVRLAPDSRLRLMGSGREVWLEGQAFFGIARDEEHPFIVRTRRGDALVLGTRFDVRVRNDDFRLVVVEGSVSVSAAGEAVDVDAGQMSMIEGSGTPAVIDVDDVYPLIDWLGPSMIFQNTPLPRVATELERTYGVRVEVVGSVLANRALTASFTDESFEEALTIICDVVGAACAIRNGVATMAPRF